MTLLDAAHIQDSIWFVWVKVIQRFVRISIKTENDFDYKEIKLSSYKNENQTADYTMSLGERLRLKEMFLLCFVRSTMLKSVNCYKVSIDI